MLGQVCAKERPARNPGSRQLDHRVGDVHARVDPVRRELDRVDPGPQPSSSTVAPGGMRSSTASRNQTRVSGSDASDQGRYRSPIAL